LLLLLDSLLLVEPDAFSEERASHHGRVRPEKRVRLLFVNLHGIFNMVKSILNVTFALALLSVGKELGQGYMTESPLLREIVSIKRSELVAVIGY